MVNSNQEGVKDNINLKALGAYLVLAISITTPLICLGLVGSNIAQEKRITNAELEIDILKKKNQLLKNQLDDIKSLERLLKLKEDL